MKTEKIQYYATDLSYALDIGDIVDMHVVTLDGGRQVLRIEHLPKEVSEYKTVKSGKTQVKKPGTKRSSTPRSDPPVLRLDVPANNPAPVKDPGIFHKVVDTGAEWMRKPMRRPDEW